MKSKFIFRGKRNTRNLVIEVGSQTRQHFQHQTENKLAYLQHGRLCSCK